MAAVVAALAATPPDASANVSCEFGGSVLNVRLSGESARATLTVAPDGAIVVSDSDLEPRECTGAVPTVNSTAAVSVVNEPGMRGTALTIRRAGRFGPGPSSADENGGSPEIELFVNSKDDPQSFVTVEADDAAGSATCCPRPRPSPSPLGAATGGSPRSAPTAWPPPTHGGSGSPSRNGAGMRRAAILAAAIALAGASPAPAAPAWLPPLDLSPAGGFARVAVNPAGDAVAVWEQFDGSNGIVRAATRRAGEPFSGAIDLSRPGDDASGAQVALDDAGNALVVWHRGGVLQATTQSAGGRFSTPVNLSLVGERASSADLAVDGSGNAVVVWAQGGSGPIKAASRPAGGSFSQPVDLSAAGVSVGAPKVAIDAAGTVVAVWRRATATSAAIQHSIRPAGGVFSAPADLSAPGGIANSPQLAMDAAGNAVAVWQARNGIHDQIQAASRKPGAGFTSLESLSALGRNAQTPEVAVGPAGSAVVAWARETPGAPVGPYEIQAVTRPAGGSFSPVADLSGGAPGGPSVAPQVAMDAAGDAVVVWRRLDAAGLYRVEAAIRPAGGAFSRPAGLSAPESYAIQHAAAIDGAGDALAVWTAFVPGSSSSRIQAAVYDATAPRLDALSIPASGVVGVPVSFSVSPFDAWSSVAGAWTFGDGATASGPAAEHTYRAPGSYRVGITLSDAAGTAVEDAREITIAPPPAGPMISRLRIAPRRFSRRARVSYRLDRAATVRFRVPGSRRFVRAARAGRNHFTLTRRRLRPGRYRLTAVPVAGGVRGRRVGATFRIVTSRAGP